MILRLDTLEDLQLHREEMPEEVFRHLYSSIQILDENYGAGRDIDHVGKKVQKVRISYFCRFCEKAQKLIIFGVRRLVRVFFY